MDKRPATTASRIATAFAGVAFVWTVACSGGSGSGGWAPGGGGWSRGGGGGGIGAGSSGFGSSSGFGTSTSSSGFGTSASSGGFGSSSGVPSGNYVTGVPAQSTGTVRAGQVGGCGTAPGQCACSDSSGQLYCGECPGTSLPCQYCPAGDYCPADLCNATTCPRTASPCPSGSPMQCGSVCCPLGYSTCCSDGVSCATDSLSCPSPGGTSTSSSGLGSSGGGSCPSGVWSLSVTTPTTCQTCTAGAHLNVTFSISSQLAASGGTFKDSDGVTWTYDPSTCRAAQSSACSAAGSLDFVTDSATCYFFCAGSCPGCAERCTLAQVQ